MDLADLHPRLDDIAPAAGVGAVDPELAAVEAHAAAGCSPCARALLNARETAAELAVAAGPRAAPAAALRARVLASASRIPVTMGGAPPNPPARPVRPPAQVHRFFDPSGELARLHIGAPGDAERTAEVDALDVAAPPEDDACARLLAQLEHMIGFPLLFVSVVRGERVGYRVQRGLDPRAGDMRDRRRETTFCTHTVSGAAPMIVPNAAEEPFFRGSNMVVRFGVKSYVGVPLTTSRGIVVGTVCAMDFRPRAIGPEIVRVLELFTQPVLAEIERAPLARGSLAAQRGRRADPPRALVPRAARGEAARRLHVAGRARPRGRGARRSRARSRDRRPPRARPRGRGRRPPGVQRGRARGRNPA
jgi:GAF domain-containing protein